jgi:hypothetical protein
MRAAGDAMIRGISVDLPEEIFGKSNQPMAAIFHLKYLKSTRASDAMTLSACRSSACR